MTVHYVEPMGAMLHALHNLSRPPQGSHFWDRVTCPICLSHRPIQENQMNPQQITEVSATVDTGLSQDDLDGMTEAERLALVVGAAYGKALADRDQARTQWAVLADRLTVAKDLLGKVVPILNDSTWASDSALASSIQAFLDQAGALDSETTPTQED